MILESLFTQYKKKRKPLLGSRWLNLHGRLFIGNPKVMAGLDQVEKENLETYYFLPFNRWAPKKEGSKLKWRQDNLRMTAVRECERKVVAKAGFLFLLPVIIGLFALSGAMQAIDSGAAKAKAKVMATSDSAPSQQECIELVAGWIQSGKITPGVPMDLTDDEGLVLERCTGEHEGFEADVMRYVEGAQ